MKKNIILLFVILWSCSFIAQVGINTPDPKATLDITAKNPTGTSGAIDGVIVPKVDRLRAASMTNIPLSTLVYVDNITTGTQTGITINVDELGFYYFDGKEWVKFRDPNNIAPIITEWRLLGNATTDPATNFIGTTDNQGLSIRTNNITRALIENSGILRFGNIPNTSSSQSTATIANASSASANVLPGVLSVIDSRLSTVSIESPPTADIFNGRGGPASDLLTIGHNSNSQTTNYTPRSIAFYNVNSQATGAIGQVAWIATPGKVTRNSETAASISDYNRDKTNNYAGLLFSTRGVSGFGSRLAINSLGNVGINTTTPTSLLDLGATFGSTPTDIVGKKLAVYNNVPGTDFYGLGISPGLLQLHAASTNDEAPGMVLTGSGRVGIGTTSPATSAALDVSSTTTGFLPPRMTTAQRNAIASKAAGLIVYNVETNCLEFWNTSAWVSTCATTTPPAGTVTALNCAGATNTGTLSANTAASGVSSSVPYTGGNGGSYNGQTVNSTGVTGLTATLLPGNFASGSGSVIYTITGTPSGTGTASFAINIGGQSCTLSRTVSATAAVITIINCDSATNNGTLTSGTAASGVSSVISYTGGNGGSHSGQTVNSTGVTGLTATLTAGNVANGNGNFTYTITGTPTSSGTASFLINVAGQQCTLNRTVNAPAGSITGLTCGSASFSNTFTNSQVAGGTMTVPYTGGNGGSYGGQTINSTGVTGLTATLNPGNFASGNGSLSYTISGTPVGEGTASFLIPTIGGQTCTVNFTVNPLTQGMINCSPLGAGAHPYPGVNTKYIQCVNVSGTWYAYIYNCPSGQIFNPATRTCVVP